MQVSPVEAFEALSSEPSAILIDVRTRAEWSFVGIPDLSEVGKDALLIEWREYPAMAVNLAFADQLLQSVDDAEVRQMYFICRSGARSNEAAMTMTEACREAGRDVQCINVAEGFEGDLGPSGHRGEVNGWKAHKLPWKQS